MGSIADEKEPSEAHWLRLERPQRSDRFFEGGYRHERLGMVRGQAAAQFALKAVVAPVLQLLVERALDRIKAGLIFSFGSVREISYRLGFADPA